MIGCPLRHWNMFMLDWCWNTFVKAWIVHVWPRAFLMILIFLLWILCHMRVILCWIVVSHRLNTKETLPKFSRNLTLNHIGESLGSRGGELRKPKMKTLFGVIATMLQTHAAVAVHFSPKTLGLSL